MPRPSAILSRARRGLRSWTRRSTDDGPQRRTIKVSANGWHGVTLDAPGSRLARHDFSDPNTQVTCKAGTLEIDLPDAASYVRLVLSGLLSGDVEAVELRLGHVPDWQAAATRSPRFARDTSEFSWRRDGQALHIRTAWHKPQHVHRVLGELLGVVLRTRLWDQINGPLFTVDRTDWLAGRSAWPQAILTGKPPASQRDEQGRSLGPYVAPSQARSRDWSIVSAVANPYGRVLKGTAEVYSLTAEDDRLVVMNALGEVASVLDKSRSPEAAAMASGISKYSVVQLNGEMPTTPFSTHALRLLGACGITFASGEPAVREQLRSLGLVAVEDPRVMDDLDGYALAVEASRTMAIQGDAALRHTNLAGENALPLPSVTAVISSKRPDDIATCIEYLGAQTYPSLEIVLGTHGYRVDEETREKLGALARRSLRIEFLPADLTLGEGLGRLARIAEGELITKLDDDDHYGPNHVTDLVLAWHQTGADMVAKGARFVYLPDLGKTLDRAWAAPELFGVMPAGGTLLIARSTLQQVGGWSTSSRHVDADLIARVRTQGGLTYRTHSLEYVYVRRQNGHTWSAQLDKLIEQSERTYEGMPAGILRPPGASGHGDGRPVERIRQTTSP